MSSSRSPAVSVVVAARAVVIIAVAIVSTAATTPAKVVIAPAGTCREAAAAVQARGACGKGRSIAVGASIS